MSELTQQFEWIRFEKHGGVAKLVLNNPAKLNAFSPAMRNEIAQAVLEVDRDPAVRALVLTADGQHFCAGGDLQNIATSGLDNAGWHERMGNLHSWLQVLLRMEKPVIAAVDGVAYGAGFSLALTADIILATPRTRFNMSFIKVGLVPDCGAFYTLPRVVGAQRAKELMLSGREVSAEEALRLGIAMELHAPEALQGRAMAMANSFVNASPVAVSLIKRCLNAPAEDLTSRLNLEASAQAVAVGTQSHREAVGAFLNKQPAPFQWPKM